MSGFGNEGNQGFAGGFPLTQQHQQQQQRAIFGISNADVGVGRDVNTSNSGMDVFSNNPPVSNPQFGIGTSAVNPPGFGTLTGPPPNFGGSTVANAPPSSGLSFGSSPNVVMASASNNTFRGAGFGSVFPTTGQQQSSSFTFGNRGFVSTPNTSPPFEQYPQRQQQYSSPFGGGGQSTSNSSQSLFPSVPTDGFSSTTFGSSSNVLTNFQNREISTPLVPDGSSTRSFGNSFGFVGTQALGGSREGSIIPNNNPFSDRRFGFDATTQSGQEMSTDDDMGGEKTHLSRHSESTRDEKSWSINSAPTMNPVQGEDKDSDVDHGDIGIEQEQMLKAKMEERKRELAARIEEKKRRLAERQKRKGNLNQESLSRSRTPTPTGEIQRGYKTLAERHVKRVSRDNSQALPLGAPLPPDTRPPQNQGQSLPALEGTSNLFHESDREELEHAVALVGTCPRMCPDDELLRRQQENDIQALEICLPGTLHPQGWTQRDTAVKRFRRSAADFKLDVPEWVRPADVLELTCSYLEEWVMERDRQGPDPRFPQVATPPPLDVYQFIWDRTRMIRKDFILQNYVGSDGLCDARAVRCHERIARWHAMCEHQLSHIPDFVSMQSQQNIQELGQTMKTLNQFYDDFLNRSTIEVPDDNGNETRDPSVVRKFAEGCYSEVVQGNDPVDYDGSKLNNAVGPKIGLRLIGKNAINSPSHGTAEPETRALYILLTMDNEGGMEVLKYAARLFKERPAVYHSTPIQLALKIFKCKKELNYVRFFAYLRSSSTPYLFSCILFKHVELMRKVAFRIMSMTYGARNKDTGEAMYDLYPLDSLVKLLCFEDILEAREACKFYNITVKERRSQSGEIREIIYWRASKFKEPRHPEKGHTLRLQPRKMVRTIEKKLQGTTRLGVCRGEVSGEGAALSGPVPVPSSESDVNASSLVPINEDAESHLLERLGSHVLATNEVEGLKVENPTWKQRREIIASEKQPQDSVEADHVAGESEEVQQDPERQRMLAYENARLEEEKSIKAEKARLGQEQVRASQLMVVEMAQKAAENDARIREEEEERVRLANDIARREKEGEELRKRIEQQEQEKERLRRASEQQHQREIEADRILRLEERQREEKRRREREEENRILEGKRQLIIAEWDARVNLANRTLLWKQWRRSLSRPLEIFLGINRHSPFIDQRIQRDSFYLPEALRAMRMENRLTVSSGSICVSARHVIEASLRLKTTPISLAKLVENESESLQIDSSLQNFEDPETTKLSLLLKVAVVCPESFDVIDESFACLIKRWVGSRVKFGSLEKVWRSSGGLVPCEIRCVVVKGSSRDVCDTADVALIIIPPAWSDPLEKLPRIGHFTRQMLRGDIRRVALVLTDLGIAGESHPEVDGALFKVLGGNHDQTMIRPSHLSPDSFDAALAASFHRCVTLFLDETCVRMTRISPMQLATNAINGTVLWRLAKNEDDDAFVECSRQAVESLMDELENTLQCNKTEWAMWPPREFATKGNTVESYFNGKDGLPLEWWKTLERNNLENEFGPLLALFQGNFRDVFQRILIDAPTIVRDDCASDYSRGQYQLCLEKALFWLKDSSPRCPCSYLYLPDGILEIILEALHARVQAVLASDCNRKQTQLPSPQTYGAKEKRAHVGEAYEFFEGSHDDHGSISRPSKKKKSTVATTKLQNREAAPSSLQHVFNPSPALSPMIADRIESAAYTRMLERWQRGETIDMFVGEVSLSTLLKNAPTATHDLQIP